MKTIFTSAALLIGGFLLAQVTSEAIDLHEHSTLLTGKSPSEAKLVAVQFARSQCLTAEQRLQLDYENQKNHENLHATHPEVFSNLKKLTLFQEPHRHKTGFDQYGYHTLQNQVDHNLTPNNHLLDYNCGQRTYDWATGNHQGTDYILWPYPWRRMQEGVMEIIAAAPGVIINKRDNYADLNCLNNGNPNWNGLVIEHSDGSTSIYMHFKKNSVTAKNIGDIVAAGEYLGLAGSSGSSTIPHLHFEVRDALGNVIDPYQGPCNSMNASSWWQQQEPYYVPRINRISTHSTATEDNTCPVVENTYEKTSFNDGETMYLKVYYRDIKPGDVTAIKITKVGGPVVSQYTWAQNWGAFYATAYAYWVFPINSGWQTGIYDVEATFGGNTYTTSFGVRTLLAAEDVQLSQINIYPNPTTDYLNISGEVLPEEVQILDLSGRLLLQPEGKAKIDVRSLSPGTYMLRLRTAEKNRTLKFIKK